LLPFLGSVGLLFAVSVRWCHCVPWCPGAAWCAVPPRWLLFRDALVGHFGVTLGGHDG
jgi:hypothetical protein